MCNVYTAGKQGIPTMFVAVKSFKLKTHLCVAIELGRYLLHYNFYFSYILKFYKIIKLFTIGYDLFELLS